MLKKSFFISSALLVILCFTGCTNRASSSEVQPTTESKISASEITTAEDIEADVETTEAETTEDAKQDTLEPGQINIDFNPEFNRIGEEYRSLEFNLKAPEYTIAEDLSNIENLDQFANLTQKQRDLLSQNGFVVTPTDSEQLFYIYEDNTYKKVPSFVTTDSVLQLYHIFYDYSLRTLESDYFYQDLLILNDNMIKQLLVEYNDAEDKALKENILTMIGYFGVSNMALGNGLPAGYPKELTALVNQEYSLIAAAAGTAKSPLFKYEIDYSLFTVRGHYTRSEELGKFFRAMSWYGIVPMPFYSGDGVRDEESAMRAIITTLALCRLPEDKGVKLWENIYSTTCFYVGESDDITPYEMAVAINKVYSETPDINQIPKKLDEFYLEIDQMRPPTIILKVEDAVVQQQMRFMGQRYIADSEILQNLSDSEKRVFPTGLDVFAVFGSERAEEILEQIYQPNAQWSGYQQNYDILSDKFQHQSIPEQTNNLYNGWLYSLKSLTKRYGAGYPLFMQNTAWEDKSLVTALGSWVEIRHDTILYGKQSAVECGGGEEPPELIGYVEPNPEFFHRLHWLTTNTRENLSSRELLNQDMQYKLERFEEMLVFLETCAVKELNGEDLSIEEQYSLLTYGGTLEYLSSSIADADDWYQIESDTDKNMAVIADIHTGNSSYLEVGVGTASEIYVVILQQNKLYLARGAVFDYYEFISGERLTDEAWQTKLKEDPPQRPPFVDSYMDELPGEGVPVPDAPYSTGC